MQTDATDPRERWGAACAAALGIAALGVLIAGSNATGGPSSVGRHPCGPVSAGATPADLREPPAVSAAPPVTARLLRGERRRKGRRGVALQSTDIERALALLRREIRPNSPCYVYFRELGADPDELLSAGQPPNLIYLAGDRFSSEAVCAMAQAGEPFSYIFLNPDCPIDGDDTCKLASLLLHEIGHLARRDVTDNEPPEFFRACRVGCLRPGDFR